MRDFLIKYSLICINIQNGNLNIGLIRFSDILELRVHFFITPYIRKYFQHPMFLGLKGSLNEASMNKDLS